MVGEGYWMVVFCLFLIDCEFPVANSSRSVLHHVVLVFWDSWVHMLHILRFPGFHVILCPGFHAPRCCVNACQCVSMHVNAYQYIYSKNGVCLGASR